MKKIFLFVLVFIFSLSLTAFIACGGSDSDYTLEVESAIQLNLYDEDRKISVSSNNPDDAVEFATESDVVTILADGTIVANKAGVATVNVSCGELEKQCVITVLDTNERPVIMLNGINDYQLGLAVLDNYPLDYSLKISNKIVNGTFTFSAEDADIVSVSADGIITAKEEGQTDLTITCVYKKWTVEKTITVNVIDDLFISLSENRMNLTTVLGVNGFETNKTIEFIGVYNGGNKVEGASVVWSSINTNVATVSNGTITAVANGKTYVKAMYSNGIKDYVAYVLVTVQDPALDTPTGFKVEDDKFVWDSVEGASGYVILDGYNTVITSDTSLKLSALNPSENYFNNREFIIYAISDNENVSRSNFSKCSYDFKSMSLTSSLEKADTYEAKIREVHISDFEADVPIYYAECTSTSLPGGDGKYGYLFKKVYFTELADVQYGVNGSAGKWCVSSIINPLAASTFYDSKITFWAYAEQETTIYYVTINDGYWGRTILYQTTIEANTWTQFTCTISEKDFPYITMLAASGNFYFADFRISKLSYSTKDYSNIYVGEACLTEVIDAIDTLPAVAQTTQYGETLMSIRNKYEALSEGTKAKVSNYSTLVEKEQSYGELIYDTIKNNLTVAQVQSMFDNYIGGYSSVTLNTFISYEKQADNIETAMRSLNASEYYGLKYSQDYAEYLTAREDYCIIEDARGAINQRIGDSDIVPSSGFAGIDGVDTVSAEIAEALVHPTYGNVISIGTLAIQNCGITFKNKADMDLSDYDYVMFGVRNPRGEKMSVRLYNSKGDVKTLATNISTANHYAQYTEIAMSVSDFMNYDISFCYDQKPTGSANIWVTCFIAGKLNASDKSAISELNILLEELSGTLTTSSQAKIDSAKELYSTLSDKAKWFIGGNYNAVISQAEAKYKAVVVQEYINDIGTVTATIESAQKVATARQAYDKLTDEQRGYVPNYQALLDAEAQLSALLYNEHTATASEKIESLFNDVGSVSLENYQIISAKVIEIDSALSQLSETQKYVVKGINKYNELKSSFVVIDDMTGNVGERFTITGATATKNTDHATYGKVLTITQSGNLSVKWNNPNSMDLSGYDRIIVGVRNGTTSAFDASFTHTNTTTHTLHKAVPASMAETGEYKLIIMSVSEFLTYGVKTNAVVGDISFTCIIAVKGVVADINSIKASTTYFDNVKVSDFKVLEDMIDENFASRLTYTDTGFFGNTNKNTWSSYFYLSNGTANFGRSAAGLLQANVKLSFKVNSVTADDLAGFTHVGTFIRNGTGLSITVPGYEIPMGQTKMVLISVADYLANGIVVSSPVGNSSGTYSIGAIFAVNMPQ